MRRILAVSGFVLFSENKGGKLFIEQKGDGCIDSAFYQIKRQNSGGEHGNDRTARHSAENRGKDNIPHAHGDRHHQHSGDERNNRRFFGATALINQPGGANKGARGKNVHQNTDDSALGADRQPLYQAYDHREQKSAEWSEQKGTQKNGNIRRVIL